MMPRLILILIIALVLGGCQKEVAQEEVLFDFESDAELDRLHWACHTLMTLTDEHATHGSRCLEMELYPSPYPGLTPMLKDNDWRAFGTLSFDIYNPQERDIEIAVRIDDRKNWPDYPDRYNKGFWIVKGLNRIEIPLNTLVTSGTLREMDLKNIHRFLIFMVNPAEKTVLYIDYIRLMR